jgi:ureidoglycolate lyase
MSVSRVVQVEPLTTRAFAPFGTVPTDPAGSGRPVNLGTALRHDHVVTLENARPDARPNLALFRCRHVPLPVRITLLERHPHSGQTFLSLAGGSWLLCVAPARPDGEPDLDQLRAFRAGRGQGIHLARGVWHHPVMALEQDAELAMLVWEDGGPGDCDERILDVPPLVQA